MNRPFLAVLLLAASAGIVHAQETKLVNCRSLEAAGNFVGSDEVLDGDRVCKKTKPGDAETAKPEATKSAQVTSSVVPANPSTGVADAARANAAAKAEARKTAVTEKPAAVPAVQPSAPVVETKPAPVPEPAKNSPAPVVSQSTAPIVADPVAPTTENHGSAAVEEAEPPAFGSANAPVTAKPKTNISRNTEVATAATEPVQAVRLRRDAPVAAGTPSEAPEKDDGFSDANAVAPVIKAAPAGQKAMQNSGQSVKTGGFDKSEGTTSAAMSQNSACAKNITLGSLRDDKFTVGVPGWAEKWIAKNQNRMGNVCFSGAPVQGVRNYLIVFYTAPANGATAAMPLPDASSGTGVFTAKDGSAWSYASKSGASTATDASGPAQIWYATAYTEEGAPVAERWPDAAKRGDGEGTSEDLLNVVVEDLHKL
jgi:hypothetical protein